MDGRGSGAWNGLPYKSTTSALLAMDAEGRGKVRPPPAEDGTPCDSLEDVFVRLRQLMSVLETGYSGETILLVFGDTLTPALLQAAFAGVAFGESWIGEFEPGEIRISVNRASSSEVFRDEARREVRG